WPWLHGIAAWIDATRRAGNHGVVACSALKRAYRDVLIGERGDVRLVYLKGERDLIARRLSARDGHFMPGSLLDSQFAVLEEPQADAHPIVLSIPPPPPHIAPAALFNPRKHAPPHPAKEQHGPARRRPARGGSCTPTAKSGRGRRKTYPIRSQVPNHGLNLGHIGTRERGYEFALARAKNRGSKPMCDYSLHSVASRPAMVGDKLVTTGFVNSYTRGFASVEDRALGGGHLSGTERAVEKEVDLGALFGLFRRKAVAGKLARFRQIHSSNPHTHHDALEFPSGKVVLLTHLPEGQRATVLQLPASTREA